MAKVPARREVDLFGLEELSLRTRTLMEWRVRAKRLRRE